jgi:hypothetical protein
MKTALGQNIIQVGFFRNDASSCCRILRYAHVELRFSDGTATSITRYPGRVHYIANKQMSNPNYSCFFQIHLDPLEEFHLRAYADEFQDETFSVFAMYWNFIFRCVPLNYGTFCSKYITMLLQKINLCKELNPLTASPDGVFESLAKDERAIVSFNKQLYF